MRLLTTLQIASFSLCLALSSQAQGTSQWTVTFDGSVPPNAEKLVRYYYESDMVFRPIDPNGQFGLNGGEHILDGYPRNGTAFVEAGFGDSLSVKEANNRRFGIVSVDISEWSTLYARPKAVQFIGYWLDGTAVTTTFITDGIIDGAGPINDFETFYFDWRFRDITRLEVPGYSWHLDNMRFSKVIPEPGVAALGLAAAASCWLRRRH